MSAVSDPTETTDIARTDSAKRACGDEHPELTKFTLTARDFRTPLCLLSAYIDWDATEWKNGAGNYLWLKMLWPSLSATSVRFGTIDQRQFDAQERLLLSGNVFRIKLTQYRENRMEYIIENHIKQDWMPFFGSPPVPGFKIYVEKSLYASVVNMHQIGQQILLPLNNDDKESSYFVCPANYTVSERGIYCHGFIYLEHGVYGEYIFSLQNITKWQQIDSAVRVVFRDMIY